MNSPKITIYTPVYNGERYLVEAVESVLNQTFRDYEYLIINDGSTDGTKAIAEAYARSDSRVIVVNKQNGGVSTASNVAIRIAKGDYLARIDADDVCRPIRLEY